MITLEGGNPINYKNVVGDGARVGLFKGEGVDIFLIFCQPVIRFVIYFSLPYPYTKQTL